MVMLAEKRQYNCSMLDSFRIGIAMEQLWDSFRIYKAAVDLEEDDLAQL
jgi:hypothetical protein